MVNTTEDVSTTGAEAPAKPVRFAALDFTKGILVMFMVLYHSLNYFTQDHGERMLVYLRFLPPSFIFITGFLITFIYLAKYAPNDPRLHKRLLVRGLKLLVVFTSLNLLVSFLVKRNFNGMEWGISAFVDNAPEIFLVGGTRRAIFEVLIPIAYLLICSTVLLRVLQLHKYGLHALFGVLLAGCYVLELNGIQIPNLEFFTIGCLGMVFGLVPIAKINRWAGHSFILAVAYGSFLAGLTFFGEGYFLQWGGVLLSVLVIYSIGLRCGDVGLVAREMVLLGKYSLLAYIVQIAALQVLLRLVRRLGFENGGVAAGFSIAAVLMVMFIHAAQRARRRSKNVDRFYQTVFG